MLRICFACTLLLLSICLLSYIAVRRTLSVSAQASNPPGKPSQRDGYLGDNACTECHQEQALTYKHTAHHLSGQLPSRKSILGSFAPGKNVLTISHHDEIDPEPNVSFKMEARDGGYYQTAVIQSAVVHTTHSERMDLVIGSGTRGQTYLYWKGNNLFELPVSYWTDGMKWINSPGYKDGTADFSRAVNARCLECHASYIQSLSSDPQANLFDPASLVPGISCESCHGPGADHVAHESNPSSAMAGTDGYAILNPAKFNRDRQVDQCALCHDGTQSRELAPAFSYRPGKPLDDYLAVDIHDISDQPDVHGNQVELLKKSRCYLSSPSMSCATCHNVHEPERPASSYSDRCLACHQVQACKVFHKLRGKIAGKCIDCHMPLQQTNAIASETAGRLLRTSIRTHWIKIYPELAR